MTQEEKAKAYNEAVNKIKPLYEQAKKDGNPIWSTYEYLFPQLTETEDEKIRKVLLKMAKVPRKEIYEHEGITKEQAITYLEKQKEQPITANDLDEEIHRFFDDCIDVHEVKLYGNISERVIPVDCYELTARHFAKWGEEHKEPIPIPDKFSGLKSLMLQYLQSAANRKDDTEIESDTDLFGRKILDYVWKYSDEQKEQKPIDYDAELEKCKHNYLYFWDKYVTVKLKPAKWSEKDEKMIRCITDRIESDIQYGDELTKAYGNQEISWLKSLRPQPEQEWSEEDKQMYTTILNLLCSQVTYVTGQGTTSGRQYPTYAKERDWFEKRFNSIRPSWKPSEEDIKMLEHIIGQYETGNKNSKVMGYLPRVEELDFLKKVLAKWKNLL